MVKTEFGNILSRVFWGGVHLTPLERGLLRRMVAELPETLRAPVEAQFEHYNLVQREADGRALNFYRKGPRGVNTTGMPVLAMKRTEAPLIRLRFVLSEDAKERHAVLTAVNGRAFCMTFDEDMRPFSSADFTVTHVTRAWRSNFEPVK